MIFKTFRARFVFVSSAVLSLVIAVFAAFIYFAYSRTLMDGIDESLLEVARGWASGERAADPNVSVELLKVVNDEFYQIMSSQGKVTIARLSNTYPWPVNRELVGSALKGKPGLETFQHNYENYRTLYYPVDADTVIRARASQAGFDQALAGLKKLIIFSLPPILLLVVFLTWIFAGSVLSPIRGMKSLAEQLKHGRWEKRLSFASQGEEINEIAMTFNDAVENIQRSIEAQKRFTADVSHEIRSPLTSLRGSMEVALRKLRSPEEYEEVLRNNLTDVIRLTRLTDNLLFLSRADNKILSLRRQWFDANQMLGDVVNGLREKAMHEGITIVEDYQHEIEMNGDIELLEQAFSNLIDNAIKYTPRRGSVTIKSREENGVVYLSVSDTGIGIPEDQMPFIFERFYRGTRDQARRQGGTGLGLAITQWIVKAHNGDISVKSTVGEGTEFTVSIPKMPD